MAYINKYPVRRLRIEGKPGETVGHQISVTDVDTGELVTNITHIVITMDARELNRAEITYLVHKDGKLLVVDGEPVEETITIDNPEVDVTAWEELRD